MAEANVPIGAYPPADHLLRDLRVVFERTDDGRSMQVEVVPEVQTDRGALDAGIAAVLVDMQAGGAALEAVRPDWVVTSDLTLHLGRPVRGGSVVGRSQTLRAGRNNVVLEVGLWTPDDERPAVLGQLGFTRVERRDATPSLPEEVPARTTFALPGSGLTRPVYEHLGLRAIDASDGVFELDVVDYQRNSVGAMQGGVVVALATRAAEALARERLGQPVVVTDVTAHYLALAREGPLRSSCRWVRADRDAAVVRVELRDGGQADRLCTVVTASVRPFGASEG